MAGENLIDFTYTENTDRENKSFVNYFALIFSKAGQGFVATSNDKTTLNDKISLSVRLMI